MSDILLLAAIVMLVLLFLKVPVYLAVLGGSMVYFALNPHVSAAVFAQQTIIGTEKISLLAIPFFVCAGIFMNYTGVTKRTLYYVMKYCGRYPLRLFLNVIQQEDFLQLQPLMLQQR